MRASRSASVSAALPFVPAIERKHKESRRKIACLGSTCSTVTFLCSDISHQEIPCVAYVTMSPCGSAFWRCIPTIRENRTRHSPSCTNNGILDGIMQRIISRCNYRECTINRFTELRAIERGRGQRFRTCVIRLSSRIFLNTIVTYALYTAGCKRKSTHATLFWINFLRDHRDEGSYSISVAVHSFSPCGWEKRCSVQVC